MSQTARNRLNFLWQRIILQKALKTTEVHDHVAGLELFNITHNTQVEIEENADKSLLFEAMDQQRLGKYPVDPTEAKEDCPFPEYDPAGKVREYTSAICEVVERWGCLGSLRPSILSDLHVRDLQETMSIRTMSEYNTFFLGKGLCGLYSNPTLDWQVGLVMESVAENGRGVYPHLVITGDQPVYGKEDYILFGELSLLLSAMRNRANQVVVDDDEEVVDSLLGKKPEDLSSEYDLSFPTEGTFPVLLLSFVGPYHGRFFQAYMNDGVLRIHQSKLYSFQNKKSPLDLFARYLLSRPILAPGQVKPYGRYATRDAVKKA